MRRSYLHKGEPSSSYAQLLAAIYGSLPALLALLARDVAAPEPACASAAASLLLLCIAHDAEGSITQFVLERTGLLATLLAALCTAWLGRGRGAQSWLRCVLAALMPVVFNFVFVGAVLTWSLTDAAFPHLNASFWLFGGQVALGEVAVLGILGLPLMRLLPRNPKFREIIRSYQKE